MTKKQSKNVERPKSIDDRFDDMTQEFITAMEQVDCAPEEFLAGIRAAARSLQDRASSYAAEIRSRDDE